MLLTPRVPVQSYSSPSFRKLLPVNVCLARAEVTFRRDRIIYVKERHGFMTEEKDKETLD